jgi:hypothetical protein
MQNRAGMKNGMEMMIKTTREDMPGDDVSNGVVKVWGIWSYFMEGGYGIGTMHGHGRQS